MTHKLKRRSFLAAGSAGAFTLLQSRSTFGAPANEKIKLGVIGTGGRGTWITRLFQDHGGYDIVACADYFEDRVERFSERFGIDASNRFTGLKGYQRLLDKGLVDAIAIETPPYFHPEQAQAGVEAGVHVYVAKPIAVDVPGCKSIKASGQKARMNKLCFLVDFQTRADEFYIEALKRVHNGALGQFAFGESSYHAGCPWTGHFNTWKDDPTNPENRLRAWGMDKVLSGDIITEQNIHTLDVASWIMDSEPLKAAGTCSLKVRPVGECNDNFQLTYVYPNDVGISFSSRQFEGYGAEGGIKNRMYGSDGVLETTYGGMVLIRGKNEYEGGNTGNIFTDGAVNNIDTFHNNILNHHFENPTVEPSVRSNLVTILGRTAAYTGEVVHWDELLEKNEKLDANLKGVKE